MIVVMENVKVVLIDIDNTLLDFDEAIRTSLQVGFKKFGLGEFTEEMFVVFNRINTAMWQRLEKGEIDLAQLKKERYNAVFKELGVDFDGVEYEKWFRTYLYDCVIPVDGAFELLESLKGKYTLCTASNGPYQQQIHRMELSGMGKYFTHHFISENLGVQKPSKEFFSKALSLIGDVKPEECLIIGDSLTSDMKGGTNAGMKTIYFNKHKEPNTKNIYPDYEFYSLAEIKEFLK